MRTAVAGVNDDAHSTRSRVGWALVAWFVALVWPSVGRAQVDIDLRSLVDRPGQEISRTAALRQLADGNLAVQRARWVIRDVESRMAGAWGAFDTILGAEARATRSEVPVDQGLSSGVSVNEGWTLSANAARRFDFGLQVTAEIATELQRSEFPFNAGAFQDRIVRGPNFITRIGVTAQQSVLRGFGREVNLLPVVLVRRELDVAELDLLREAGLQLATLVAAWEELVLAHATTSMRWAALERAERQLRIGEAQMEAGRIAPIELDLLRQRVAASQEAVLVAWSVVDQRSAEVAEVLGLNPIHVRRILPVDDVVLQPPSHRRDPGLLCELTESSSVELAVLRAQRDRARAALVETSDALRPSLDVTAGVTQGGLNRGFIDAWSQVFGLDATTIFGGLVFSMPLGNRAATSRHEQAAVAVDRAEFEVRALSDSLCRQIHQAVDQATLAEQRVAIANYRGEIAGRAQEAEEQRFAQGLSTVQLGLDALDNLEAVEAEVLRNETDFRLAQWQLARLTGELTNRLLALAGLDPVPGPAP